MNDDAPEDLDLEDPILIETNEALAAFAARVAEAKRIAIDVEANSLHAYRERACVLQATLGRENAILDLLVLDDLSPLARALDRDDIEVVFHGGDYDIALLSREHDFRFHCVFDTMIAATLLGEERVGLANLVLEAFGVTLDKKFQKADWGQRPLTPEHVDYLYRDTAYLPELRRRLHARLEAADLLEEADIEFRRLAARRGVVPEFDPEGWRKMKGTQGLDDQGRSILKRLWLWRDGVAESRGRPPFKVFPPRVMVDLASRPPKRLDRPDDLRAVPASLRRRHGRSILEALRKGLDDARDGRAPIADTRKRLTPEERQANKVFRKREDTLRAWRKKEAARRKVPNLVVLPNPALLDLCREMPESVATLAAHPGIGEKRAQRYGKTLLDVLHGRAPAAGKAPDEA